MFGNAPASPAPNRNRIATQRLEAARRAGQHRERRPPQHDARQHAARPLDVAEPAGGNLEQRVGERERAEHHAHLQDGQMQILHDERRRGGDADAIEVGDDGEQKREPEDADTDAGHLRRGL